MKKFLILMVSICLVWTLCAFPSMASGYFGVNHSMVNYSSSQRYERVKITNYQSTTMHIIGATVKVYVGGVVADSQAISNIYLKKDKTTSVKTDHFLNTNYGKYNYALSFGATTYGDSGTDY